MYIVMLNLFQHPNEILKPACRQAGKFTMTEKNLKTCLRPG
jgi:hypothetical protein